VEVGEKAEKETRDGRRGERGEGVEATMGDKKKAVGVRGSSLHCRGVETGEAI
jgi:hypothetical protein